MHELHHSIKGHWKYELFPEDDLKRDGHVFVEKKHIDGVNIVRT